MGLKKSMGRALVCWGRGCQIAQKVPLTQAPAWGQAAGGGVEGRGVQGGLEHRLQREKDSACG